MEERDFFDEKPEQRNHTLTCPHCGKAEEYQLGWLVRRKKMLCPAMPMSAIAPACQGAIVYGSQRRSCRLQEHPLPQTLRRGRRAVRRIPVSADPTYFPRLFL